MREKKLLKQRVEIRQTKRITSLLGLLVLMTRLANIITEKSEEEIRSESKQLKHFEEKLDDNLSRINQSTCFDLSMRRNNITQRAHGSKTKLKNFSVALSTMMAGIHRKKKQSKKFRRRNGSIFKRTQDPNLLSYQIWAMRRNGELSEENMAIPRGLMENLGMNHPIVETSEHTQVFVNEMLVSGQFMNYQGREKLKYIYNKLSRSQHFIKRNNLGSITQYESYFKDRIEQLLSIKDLRHVQGLRGYYNLIRMQKSETVEISPSRLIQINVVDNIADIDNFDQKREKESKLKSMHEFSSQKTRNFVKRNLQFEDCQKDSRGVLKAIDICLKKIFKDLMRERVVLFNFEDIPGTPS